MVAEASASRCLGVLSASCKWLVLLLCEYVERSVAMSVSVGWAAGLSKSAGAVVVTAAFASRITYWWGERATWRWRVCIKYMHVTYM